MWLGGGIYRGTKEKGSEGKDPPAGFKTSEMKASEIHDEETIGVLACWSKGRERPYRFLEAKDRA